MSSRRCPRHRFDLALVEGITRFPAPSLDWFYLSRVLKKGGVMVIDDIQVWSCRMVADFLDEEELWQRQTRNDRLAVYRLLAEPDAVLSRSWSRQPYVARRFRSLIRTPAAQPSRIARALKRRLNVGD